MSAPDPGTLSEAARVYAEGQICYRTTTPRAFQFSLTQAFLAGADFEATKAATTDHESEVQHTLNEALAGMAEHRRVFLGSDARVGIVPLRAACSCGTVYGKVTAHNDHTETHEIHLAAALAPLAARLAAAPAREDLAAKVEALADEMERDGYRGLHHRLRALLADPEPDQEQP